MKKMLTLFLAMGCILIGLNGIAAEQDAKGCADHPLLTRMPDFRIGSCKEKDFDRHEFLVQEDKKVSRIAVEGHKYYFEYNLMQGAKGPGDLKVVRNIENALTQIGGKTIFNGERPWSATIRLEKDGKEIWVAVLAWPTLYRLTIVEKEAMQQVVEANAEAMGNDIKTTGHVSVYGIYFDTGKSEIKPESDAAIAEIAKLLQEQQCAHALCRRPYRQHGIVRCQHEAFEGPCNCRGQFAGVETWHCRVQAQAIWGRFTEPRRFQQERSRESQEPAGGTGGAVGVSVRKYA